MKKILITGANSYVGTNVEKWLMKEPDKYYVKTLDMKDSNWREFDFSKFDVVFHVAGIAHIREKKKNKNLYFDVNRDLAVETAKKSKLEGIKQFIFLSTMSVYGKKKGIIYENTPVNPKGAYGKSKLEAEELIKNLNDPSFIVTILRPPMIYGNGCKGNYTKLANLALKSPLFLKVDNARSMIYIENLSEFVKLVIDNFEKGMFFPQNSEYVNTSELVQLINKTHGRKILMTKLFNPILRFTSFNLLNKLFGTLIYDKYMSLYKHNYEVCNFKQSIYRTEENMSEKQ